MVASIAQKKRDKEVVHETITLLASARSSFLSQGYDVIVILLLQDFF